MIRTSELYLAPPFHNAYLPNPAATSDRSWCWADTSAPNCKADQTIEGGGCPLATQTGGQDDLQAMSTLPVHFRRRSVPLWRPISITRQRPAHCERADGRIERLVAFREPAPPPCSSSGDRFARRGFCFCRPRPRVKDLLGKKAALNTTFPYLLERTPW